MLEAVGGLSGGADVRAQPRERQEPKKDNTALSGGRARQARPWSSAAGSHLERQYALSTRAHKKSWATPMHQCTCCKPWGQRKSETHS